MSRTLIVVNPASRAGATERGFGALERRLREALGSYDLAWTKGPRDAVRIAREAATAGYERLLVGGGDGTASEIATGLLGADMGEDVTLGFLPLGTGGDLLRTLGVPRALGGALAILRAGKTRVIDAGRLDYTDDFGQRAQTYFANETSAGLAGLVAQLVTHATKSLGATGSFLLGTLRGLARYQPLPARVRVDGELAHAGPLVLATASGGRYFGGGMHVAPNASVSDGLLHAVIIPGMGKPELLARLPSLYAGSHLRAPGVRELCGRVVEIEPLGPRAPRFECDGEALGTAPLRAEIVPRALRVIAP
ncbi:MAG TPA: diacylglycerol kinase family protein [Myxococcota bacterium]|nr:diacylglycerol kinase family protein [Myxococcota bacterium]